MGKEISWLLLFLIQIIQISCKQHTSPPINYPASKQIFLCDKCSQKFLTQLELNNHQETKHICCKQHASPLINCPASKHTFLCDKCSQKFLTQLELNNHQETEHIYNAIIQEFKEMQNYQSAQKIISEKKSISYTSPELSIRQ